mgnify:CR=1 FL=1
MKKIKVLHLELSENTGGIVPEFAGKPSPSPPEAGPVSHHAAIKVYGTVPSM